jgi:hypothetical protein
MTQMNNEPAPSYTNIDEGLGSDRSPIDRPGIPQELSPPQPLASAHWLEPEQQTTEPMPLVGHGLQRTPVFSTAVPTHGLSGLLRRVAYGVPDYRARRWLLLMVADRIDVLEHRPARLLKLLGVAGMLGMGIFAARKLASS